MRRGIGEADLHSFVDGELDSGRAAEVESWIEAHAPDSARVAHWRDQNAAIRHAFDSVAREPLPVSLSLKPAAVVRSQAEPAMVAPRLDQIRAARRRQRATLTAATFLGGACAALLAAYAIQRSAYFSAGPANFVSVDVVDSLPVPGGDRRARLAWRTYAADLDGSSAPTTASQRAAIAEALTRRTGLARIPDLGDEGFALVSARIMPGESEPAAFVLYESQQSKARLALIAERRAGAADRADRLTEEGGLRCLHWASGRVAYVLAGQADPETMRNIARSVDRALAARP